MEELVQATPQQPKPKPSRCPYTSSPEPEVERPEQVSPATRLRKRQIGSDGDDNEHQLKRARLTRKNLALFDKMAKKKGSNMASASAPPESTAQSSTTKTTSTITSGFAIHAYKNGILDPVSSKPPQNLEDIRERAARSRATASPTESEYKRYVNRVEVAPNEATMVVEVSGQLLKNPTLLRGLGCENSARSRSMSNVSGAVLYKDNPHSLTLPHLAGEWKGPGKDMAEARLQSAYDGAALVYARIQALSYVGKPDPPGHAEVTTFTTDGTNVNLYAHYAALSEDGTLEFHQYPVRSTNLIDSHQGLKDGRRGLRNEQDHARKESCALRDQLKEHWKQRRGGLHPIAEGAPLPVADGTYEETTVGEDEAGYEVVELPCQPTPAASSRPRKASSSVSSKSLPPANDYAGSGGQKRKASLSSQGSSHESSRQRSRGKIYWTWDAESGQYFHKHSDGRITWLEDSDDGN
ncbi:hypothetical protein DL769_005637 [Monosporascus sp. CRB-8-3]|nr:hypothetical protein DL769_005637 [Monosporascus sp. CRB-8-3]